MPTKTLRHVVLGAVAAITTLGGISTSTSADDGSGACATRYEFRQVRNGMTQARVGRIFGTNGTITSRGTLGYRFVNRSYRPCRKNSYISVRFLADPGEVLTVDGKSAFWF